MHYIKYTLPKNILLLFGIVLVLLQPFFSIGYYYWMQINNSYPTNADSIGIPIFYEFVAFLIIAPIIILGLIWALKNYKGKLQFTYWNERRWLWSSIWSILFIILLLILIVGIIEAIVSQNIIDLANYLLWFYLIVSLRAIIVSKKGFI